MTRRPNEYEVNGELTYIYLYDKEGKHIASAIIDTKNLPKVTPYRWHYDKGYAKTGTLGYTLGLHRLILGLPKNPNHITDHINRNPLDNREVNLRHVTHQENALNSNRCDKTTEARNYKTFKDELDLEEITKDLPPQMQDLLLWSQTKSYQRFIDFLSTLYPENESLPSTFRDLRLLQDWPDLLIEWKLRELKRRSS